MFLSLRDISQLLCVTLFCIIMTGISLDITRIVMNVLSNRFHIQIKTFFFIPIIGNPNVTIASTSTINDSSQVLLNPNNIPTSDMNKVGQSVFYDCIDLSPTAEKQDDMKPERSDTEEESKSLIW